MTPVPSYFRRPGMAKILPSLAASGLMLLTVVFFVGRAMLINDKHLIYPIDDAYGHMAIAKNLARHGVWGFSAPNGFSSGASSLLWPLVLAAAYLLCGVNAVAPVALNAAAAVGVIFYAGAMLRRVTHSRVANSLVLLAVVVVTPLPLLVMVGMEHCLHALICLVFLDLICQWLARDFATPRATMRWLLPVMAFLLTMVRYEGLFLVGIAGFLLCCRREWKFAAVIGGAAAAPVVVFGCFSLSQGWAFLPCSVLLKGNALSSLQPAALLAFARKGYDQMVENPHVLFLVVAMTVSLLVQFQRRATLWNYRTLILFITLATTAAHLQFAQLGWYYRYEGYLLVAGVVAVGITLVDYLPAREYGHWRHPAAWPQLAAWLLAAVLFGAPAWQRTSEALGLVTQACHNIYEQQYQMARFMRRYYQGQGVAANDIGAIDYLADVRLCDLAGLADMDVMRGKRAGTYDQQTVRRLLAKYDVRVIVVYDYWAGEYGGPLPEWGVPIGEWTIPGNIVCAYEKVSFYAPRPELAANLTRALQDFASSLPADVVQEGVYRSTRPPHVLGTYYPANDREGTYHWTSHVAQFFLYPEDEQPKPGPGSFVTVSVKPETPEQSLDVLVNGKLVQQRKFAPGELKTWVLLKIEAPWSEGMNVLTFEGHGKTVVPSGDNRKILFGVREPRWR